MRIPEDYPNGAMVTCITASDADFGENARITFTFDTAIDYSDQPLPFRIHPDIGCIFVDSTVPLNYEKQAFYNISIEVCLQKLDFL